MMRLLLTVLIVGGIFLPASAPAQINVQNLGVSYSNDFVFLESASVIGPLVGIQYDSVASPLTRFDASGQERTDIVQRVDSIGLLGSWAVDEKLSLGFDTAFAHVRTHERGNESAFGDTRLSLKRRVFDHSRDFVGAALMGHLILPTGEQEKFTSYGSWGAGVTLAIEKRWPRITGVANVGYTSYEEAKYGNLDLSAQIPAGVGIRIPVSDGFALNVETRGVRIKKGHERSRIGEYYLGAGFRAGCEGRAYFGLSTSEISGDSTSRARFVAGYKFVPGQSDCARSETIVERVNTVTVVERCGPETITRSFPARRLTPEELRNFSVLPYRSTKEHPITTKQLGEMTGFWGGMPYVADAQILFAVDLHSLPPQSMVINVNSALLKMEVRKVSSDNAKDTEILCLLNEGVCSGEYFRHPAWKANINEKFTHGKETPNDYFTKQFINASAPVTKVQNKDVFAGDLVIPLERIIENSSVLKVQQLFYHKNSDQPRTLYLLVADDTYLSNRAQIDISMEVDSCRRPKNGDEP